VARRRNPARLVIALSVAAVLAVFLLYTSFAGGATPSLRPSQLDDHPGKVSLAGRVIGPVGGDARGAGLRFRLRDIDGTATVPVVYRGSVPDLFQVGRQVYMQGQLANGVFVAEPDSLVTKCPSKYAPTDS
jgi:cytochrome c-type biogenesis protein CcmE